VFAPLIALTTSLFGFDWMSSRLGWEVLGGFAPVVSVLVRFLIN
jgi:hypothetical protein